MASIIGANDGLIVQQRPEETYEQRENCGLLDLYGIEKPLVFSASVSTDDDTTVCSSLPESEAFDEDLSTSACSARSFDQAAVGTSYPSQDVNRGVLARRQRTAQDIRRHYACKLGIRHPRVELQQLVSVCKNSLFPFL